MRFIKTRKLPLEEVEKIAGQQDMFFHERPLTWFQIQGEKRVFTERAQLWRLNPDEEFLYTAMDAKPLQREGYEPVLFASDKISQVDLYIIRPKGYLVSELAHGGKL